MKQHAGARGMRFVVFTCDLLRVNLPRTRFIHAQCTVHYGVVIVGRNLEKINQNDGFKMTALEKKCMCDMIKGNESNVANFGLEIRLIFITDDVFQCFTLFQNSKSCLYF